MSESITLRKHLTGELNDLVESANLGVLGKSSIVSELVCLFADYEEEGATLFLDAFLTNDLKSLTKIIPESNCLKLGSTTCDENGIKKAVKRTAPLVRGCWKMFIAPNSREIEYGLFRDSGHPLNVPLDITFQTGGSGDSKFIRITKLARDTVRVVSQIGKSLIIHFTNSKEITEEGNKHIAHLCETICSGLEGKLGQSCKTYLESLLSTAVRESHGSLIAVVSKPKVPAFLSDCTNLNPILSFSAAVESVLHNSDTIPQLHALESLLYGMFRCDGIVIFDTKANLLAYNAFIKVKSSDVVGGARRRAFQALSDKVNKGLQAVFIQSQDGASAIRR
jgi:hypothetical protein